MRTKLIYNTAMENNVKTRLLSEVTLNTLHRVVEVIAPPSSPEWTSLLQEIGFLPGEQVAVSAVGMFGGDPLVVKIGVSSFAIRLAEARCITVTPIIHQA